MTGVQTCALPICFPVTIGGVKSVWDMIQGIASAIGWVIWYKYNSTTSNFELTFQSVPRNKTAADYLLDYKENLLSLPVEMSGTEIYNQMLLYYTDSATGTVKYVSAENTASDEIEFSKIIPSGETINVLYSYQSGIKKCVFSGYVGNSMSISEDNSTIDLTCSDEAYRLQKAYIDNVQYNIVRTYAVEKVYAEELIQNTLDDIFGAGGITLYTPVASGQLIEITCKLS